LTESQFISDNIGHWDTLEKLLTQSSPDPDKLQELFVKVSGDLSYASTYYPNRSVRLYLNKLTQQVFDRVEKDSKSKFSFDAVGSFFQLTLPLEMYRARRQFLLALIVFVVAILIGAVSTANSDDFAALILGDNYVQMTEANINNGDPMAVYKDDEQVDMFLGITINNIRVSFFAFVGGIFAGLGTFILLLYNGIMLGAFQYFFYQKGLLATSFFTIWIHGTIEISAIIIAGAAGFVLGSGLLFPGTYTRAVSLQISAVRAVRIIVGIVPLFILAGFLESFVTRLTDMPLLFKAVIILSSLALIVGLYVVYPLWVHKHYGADHSYDVRPSQTAAETHTTDQRLTYGETLAKAFGMYRTVGGQYLGILAKCMLPVLIVTYAVWIRYFWDGSSDPDSQSLALLTSDHIGVPSVGIFILLTAFAMVVSVMLFVHQKSGATLLLQYLRKHYLKAILLMVAPVAILFFFEYELLILYFLFVPPQFICIKLYEDDTLRRKNLFVRSFYAWGHCLVHVLVLALFHYLIFVILGFGVGEYLADFLMWHDIFTIQGGSMAFFSSLLFWLITLAMLPLYCFAFLYSHKSTMAQYLAIDLKERYTSFGQESIIFESKPSTD